MQQQLCEGDTKSKKEKSKKKPQTSFSLPCSFLKQQDKNHPLLPPRLVVPLVPLSRSQVTAFALQSWSWFHSPSLCGQIPVTYYEALLVHSLSQGSILKIASIFLNHLLLSLSLLITQPKGFVIAYPHIFSLYFFRGCWLL